MTTTTDRTRVTQAGPPLGVLALVSTGLFVASLIFGTVLAGGELFPSPFGDAETILGYVSQHAVALQVAATLQFASAVPLAIYAATAHAQLGQLGIRAPGATIALAGGLIAATLLMISAVLQWSLSRPDTVAAEPLVRALHDLAFLTGGPGNVVALGLLIAGVAVPGLLAGLLPRPMAWAGLVIALIAELSTLVLLIPGAGVLLPLGRFPGLIWLIAAGFLLPRHRRRNPANDSR